MRSAAMALERLARGHIIGVAWIGATRSVLSRGVSLAEGDIVTLASDVRQIFRETRPAPGYLTVSLLDRVFVFVSLGAGALLVEAWTDFDVPAYLVEHTGDLEIVREFGREVSDTLVRLKAQQVEQSALPELGVASPLSPAVEGSAPAQLNGTQFNGAQLNGAQLNGAQLNGADGAAPGTETNPLGKQHPFSERTGVASDETSGAAALTSALHRAAAQVLMRLVSVLGGPVIRHYLLRTRAALGLAVLEHYEPQLDGTLRLRPGSSAALGGRSSAELAAALGRWLRLVVVRAARIDGGLALLDIRELTAADRAALESLGFYAAFDGKVSMEGSLQ